ncbi:MAG TPA: cation:proton antiporter [Galbitalea sp.]|jgi:cell volume regulation protein A|nr:cation:proton antiporter [Galbitalea sp.]
MNGIESLAVEILLISLAVIGAVFSNRLSTLIRVPAPALFLIVAAIAAKVFPVLGLLPRSTAENIVTIALVFILFDGGMHIGWRRFRASLGAITWLGLAGTAVTAIGVAAAAHFIFGFDFPLSLLLGAALSPTDPAVVFSVLGKREISGRTGVILEGESGANDPVGIALIVSLLAVTGSGADAVFGGTFEFLLQMIVGAVVGVAGGYGLAKLMRHVSLPNEALYSIRTIACATLIYAAATVLHGSGFLAVLLAGILVGDSHAPFKREIQRFTSGIASMAEIAAFSILGLSVSLDLVFQPAVLWTGLGIAALLILVIRPLLVGLLLIPIRLRLGERAFVLWAGLKGAVPILLGMFILDAKIVGADRVYAVIFVVVLASVVIQGGLVPLFARLFRVPMRVVEPEPWASGLRFRERPEGMRELVVSTGSAADGSTVDSLALGETGWISLIRRDGKLVQVRGSTHLAAGDVVLALADDSARLDRVFGPPGSS